MNPKDFNPYSVQEGDMAVATDEDGDHFCVFIKRKIAAWEILSVTKQNVQNLSDEQFVILTRVRNFRLVVQAE